MPVTPGGVHVYGLAWKGTDTLYAGGGDGHVYSKTGPGAWTDTGATGCPQVISLVLKGSTLFAAGGTGHVYSWTGAGPWTDAGDTGCAYVFCLARNGRTLYAGTENGVFTTTVPSSTHTITASCGPNGTVSPSGAVAVEDGADQTFTITPGSSSQLVTLTVDGAPVALAPTYTFNNVATDHTIVATFTGSTTSSTFYFAEGSCRPNFDPYICIQNPGGSDASVTITYMKGNGANDTQNVTVLRNSGVTVRCKDKLGEANDAAHDFSSKVECTSGGTIIAERPMYFNYNGVWTGGHDVVGFTQ
jgi:hypothetical protein